MKRNIIKVAFVAAFSIVAGFNCYNSQKTDMMSDLALANVEALAQNEIENYYSFHLVNYSSGCNICKRGGTWCNVHDQVPC